MNTRLKVIEFMNLFENALSTGYQDYPNSDDLLNLVKRGVKDQANGILSGKNNEVEKRLPILGGTTATTSEIIINCVRNYYFWTGLFRNS